MDQENPLVKQTAADTLNEVVNSLIYIVDTMPSLEHLAESVQSETMTNDDAVLIFMQRDQYSGLKNTIDGVRSAVETCFSQHGRELAEKDELIRQLQQSITQQTNNNKV